MKHSVALLLLAVPHALATPSSAQHGAAAAARGELERSSWFADVTQDLQRGEYHFSVVHGEEGAWSAPNRAHEFRSRLSASGIEVFPRAADAGAQWKLVLATKSFGRSEHACELNPATVRVTNERVELDRGWLTESFVNEERGLEQGWTIASSPSGADPLWIGLDVSGDLSLRIDAGARSGVFVDARGEPRLRYTGLMVFDATGRELDARLASSPHGVGISIDDAGAVYPLTVDPLLTGPAWTAESDQNDASFGWSVATAGDVNGDGYSDVIVGAYRYDNGRSEEGRASLYLGSGTGLSTDAAWTAEGDQDNAWFGFTVATAGDVNGDGYSDVIAGAGGYHNGQSGEGRAFVYLGSAAGLSASAAWTAESDQDFASFGNAVATAGDVNGDGYSDVIVGAAGYDNGEVSEGRAFVYMGSSAGLAASAAWTAESDQVVAFFGYRVSTAGDVNGDGYGDVIVSSPAYENGQFDEGRVFVYLGSGAGLSTSAAWTAESNQNAARFGDSVATAGDVNGDGYTDVIVGAPFYDNGLNSEGGAFLYLGSGAGLSVSAAWTAEGEQNGAGFGYSAATAGDVNGDGYSDVIVGAPGYDNGESGEGRAYVYLGSGAGISTSADLTIESDQISAGLGISVATAGDVNGDGHSDVIVGAAGYSSHGQTNEGRAFVYLGSGTGLSSTAASTSESDQMSTGFGFSVATAGDVNGDGYSDVIVGSYLYDHGHGNEGCAFVYLGSAGGLSSSAAWTGESDQNGAQFGFSVATAGDVNGDGYSDVIVGAYFYSNGESREGRAYVYLGSSAGLSTSAAWSAESDQVGAFFGCAVATAGDVNGDGYGDVIIGAYGYDDDQSGEGRAYVYLGSAAGLSTSADWTDESDNVVAGFGMSVATAGDVNRDGYSDVIVGAHRYSNGQAEEGRAFVYLGSGAGLSTSTAWTAESNDDFAEYGFSVATAGDVNGDGYSDVIVGASHHENGPLRGGRAFVYLGSGAGLAASPSWTAESDQQNARFGYCVSTAGDVNGDGYSDVIVGAFRYDNGEADEGRAFVYLGSSTGLSTGAAWTAESDQTDAYFGVSVATAGDVNGDGYSDVIVGAYRYNNGQFDEGRTSLYLGNEGRGGWTLAPQQRQANDAAPIDLLGRSSDKHEFRIRLGFERNLAGFAWASGLTPKARLEWEVRPLRAPLDGSHVESGVEQTITGSPLTFNEIVEFPASADLSLSFGSPLHIVVGANAYHWRARVRTNNPLLPVTPWVTIPWNNVTEAKLRAGPLERKR